ncbi:MAG: YbaB/EbfC family nucleoid-associated protein [Acidimicrobiales bacterium]
MSFEPPDLSALMRQAQELGEQMADAQARAGEQTVEGTSGGGAVRVVVTGDNEFQSVHIDPAVVDPDDLSLLEDLVLAALNDSMARVVRLRGETLGAIAPGLLSGMPGLGHLPGPAGVALGEAETGTGGTGGPDDEPDEQPGTTGAGPGEPRA